MLTQKINPLKLALALFELHSDSRHSLLDVIVLLLINEHPDSGKSDLCEILYGDRTATKSSLDRPVKRLLASGLIEQLEQTKIATKSGGARSTYRVSAAGGKFLNGCK